ncbi:class I SAM-dependent methyltransferase [Paraflavisolibacter sp. H34]|uniref:class I SAM-dependent DNA methyltransferase n=1 Tax=Huijunlia imazamoxiresistens TaxID=3127457 RepID=UPI00301A7E36
MNTQQAYNRWSEQYDTNRNRTRDLEAEALRKTLAALPFTSCLEIGCGTGKNTQWLAQKAQRLTAVDLSAEMMARAKQKVTDAHVSFQQADITQAWTFRKDLYDLVSFSLVLEHIEHLDPIFAEAANALVPGGWVYIGELHPFKQYTGTRARFDSPEGTQVLECFVHNLSDFVQAARKHGLQPADINEYFDDNDRTVIPRILTMVFRKG